MPAALAKSLPLPQCATPKPTSPHKIAASRQLCGAQRRPRMSAPCSWQQRPWQLLAVVLYSLPLVLGAPALADTSTYSITQNPTAEQEEDEQYFITVPQDISADDKKTGPRLGSLIEGPKGKQVQQCARKCVPTCIRGGQGAPGLGPMSMRKEIVVFKEGYRTRSYCLSECTQVCALQVNGNPQPEAAK